MITRRTALAMLPAGLMAGSSFISLARAQPLQPTFRPNPQAARDILSRVDQAGRTAHHEAAKALIQSYIRVATLRNSASDAKSKLNSKDELRSALDQHDAMHSAVKIALDSRKKTDEIIDKEKEPHGRRLSESEKIKLGSAIDIKNNELKQLLGEVFGGSGEFDVRKVQSSKIARLNALSEELLRAGRDLSTWGPDSFYAMARGYATFQLVRYCVRTGATGTRTTSSLILARAHTLKVIADSESYCAHRAASLAAPPPSLPTAPPQTGSTLGGELSWSERHDVEKYLIDKFFPKEVYLGSQIGRDTNCEDRSRRIRNFYGTFTSNSSFDRGFKMEGVSTSDCVATINDRRREALNNILSDRTKFPAPSSGSADQFKDVMRSVEESLNNHIRVLKRQKERENPAGGDKPPPPPPPDDASREFTVMQQMAAALREVLALT